MLGNRHGDVQMLQNEPVTSKSVLVHGTFVGVPADVRDVFEIQRHADVGLRELARLRLTTATLYRVPA